MMGINIIGTREIAVNHNLNKSLDSVFSSLFALNSLMTFGALGVLVIVTLFVPEIQENREMMGIGALKILGNLFLIEWFYKGIENFKFITLRSIIIKALFVIAVYLFVKEKSDYKVYYFLTALMVAGNAIINSFYSRNFATFRIKLIHFKLIAAPFFILGLYILLSSFYTNLNVVFLGFVHNDTEVGYYSTSVRLYSILMALFTGATTVLMPRMSGLIAQNRISDFKNMAAKTTRILFSFTIPIIIFSVIFAPQIIMIISGPGYEGAIGPMRIVMPLMLVIGYEQIQIVQCLTPLKQDKILMRNSAIGAGVGIVLNVILVPYFAAVGSAWTWFAAEVTLLILAQFALNKVIDMKFPWNILLKSIFTYIPLAIILIGEYFLWGDLNEFLIISVAGVTMVLYFIVVELFIFKNPMFLNLAANLKLKF